MINEERNIIFSNEALRAAFELDLSVKSSGSTVLRVTLQPDASCVVESEANGAAVTRQFTQPEVLAIIVKFARHIGMPLPRRAQKAMFGLDDRLAMQMSLAIAVQHGHDAKLAYLGAARRLRRIA